MARSATRTVIIKKRAETAPIELRCGETALGTLRSVTGTTGDGATMAGQFTHAPAFTEFAEKFMTLTTALRENDAATAAGVQTDLETAGLHIYHTQHDMRIDRPASLRVVAGEVQFAPNDAYLMMRTGGL